MHAMGGDVGRHFLDLTRQISRQYGQRTGQACMFLSISLYLPLFCVDVYRVKSIQTYTT